MNFRTFFLYFLIISPAFSAQEKPVDYPADMVKIDSALSGGYKGMLPEDSVFTENYSTNSVVYPKNLRPGLKSKYKGPEFDYTTTKPRESLWDRIKKRIFEILRSIFGEVDVQKTGNITVIVLRLLAVLLGGFLVYLLIRYLLGKDGNFFFSKKNKKLNIRDENLTENIHEINFNEEILRYENDGNYRYALRYLFLKTLKQLSDKKLIDWVPEKTNRDYLSELKSNQRENFRELVRIFDYVWYGEFKISRNNYEKFKSAFNSFKI